MNYYIYGLFHEKPKNNFTPKLFYVGRGCGRRMNRHFNKSRVNSDNPINPHKTNTIKKCKENNWNCYPKKLYNNLKLKKAKELEKFILNDDCLFEQLTNLSQSAHGGSDVRGEDCIWSKLTKKEVRHIKWLLKNTSKMQNKIAEHYKISKGVLTDIKKNRSWKHIQPKKPNKVPNITNTGKNEISNQIKSEIKWLLKNAQLPQEKIANKYGISAHPVSEINNNPEKFDYLDSSKPSSIPKGKKKTCFLSNKEVSEIKWLAQNTDYAYPSIGKKYNVVDATVRKIKKEEIHKNIESKKPENISSDLKTSHYIGENKAGQIKWLLNKTNLSQSKIGSLFDVHRKTVSSINCQKTYKQVNEKKPNNTILNKIKNNKPS